MINSEMINNVKLENLVTTHETENLFSISILKGDVTIKRLFVHGKFNGYNITELSESLVKLNGDQEISSTLVFQDELNVNKLEIIENLNDHRDIDYIYTSGDNVIDWDIEMQNVSAENLLIEGNFTGDIRENDFTTIREKFLSYTKDQTIEVPFEIMSAEVENWKTENINGVKFAGEGQIYKETIEKLRRGLIHVESKLNKIFLLVDK